VVSIRPIRSDELPQLIELYQHLHSKDAPLPTEDQLQSIWRSIQNNPDIHYLVAEIGGQFVSSCTLAIIPNLTRGARPWAVVENVVTHTDFRRRGLGIAVLKKATEIARQRNCYKIMLLTGSKREETFAFYERAGFRRNVKTGFVMVLE
jgi:ribosomal protein S18 acetylase RimI-like enzyme